MKLPLLLLLSGMLLGCGGGEDRFKISGMVSYDGDPISNGTIGFVPLKKDTGLSVGADIIDGRFEFSQYDGPTSGSYKVIIYAEQPIGRKLQADEGSQETIDEMVQYIPWIYNEQSTLSAEISGDQNDLDFDLDKPKRTKRTRRRL